MKEEETETDTKQTKKALKIEEASIEDRKDEDDNDSKSSDFDRLASINELRELDLAMDTAADEDGALNAREHVVDKKDQQQEEHYESKHRNDEGS